uniref:Ulp1 protease family, C-terminal catalytic domain-containing protein n=1 Tax=Helianthus annuus TaxID=4232 RepID=A0A251VEI3_HELAN
MHPKMSPLEPEIMKMSWQTEKNFVDCGVFAMRHMETYTGKHVSKKEWDSGLSKELNALTGPIFISEKSESSCSSVNVNFLDEAKR